MALLKEDGSLDMERIEKLNIFESMEEAGGWTREQMREYESKAKFAPPGEPVKPVIVDHRIAEAHKRGIHFDPKQVKQVDGVWCLGECPELDADMERDGTLYLKIRVYVDGNPHRVKMIFTISEATRVDENTIRLRGMVESDSLNGEKTLLYDTKETKCRFYEKEKNSYYQLKLETWDILPDGAHNAEMLEKIKELVDK